MPRFFFHIRDHVDIVDRVGVELAGLREARVHAVAQLGDLLGTNPALICNNGTYRIEVTDATPRTVFILHILAIDVQTMFGSQDPTLLTEGTPA